MSRRRYPWGEIAAMARKAGGAWRLHTSLVAVTPHTLQHARRRVRALRPQPDGVFEFDRGAVGENDLGETIFDLYVRFVAEGTEP
jgi:hypothetical protein